jgi:hypothetical protein
MLRLEWWTVKPNDELIALYCWMWPEWFTWGSDEGFTGGACPKFFRYGYINGARSEQIIRVVIVPYHSLVMTVATVAAWLELAMKRPFSHPVELCQRRTAKLFSS